MEDPKATRNRVQHAVLGSLVALFIRFEYPDVDLAQIFLDSVKDSSYENTSIEVTDILKFSKFSPHLY